LDTSSATATTVDDATLEFYCYGCKQHWPRRCFVPPYSSQGVLINYLCNNCNVYYSDPVWVERNDEYGRLYGKYVYYPAKA
jgi:hypothetical protein